MAGKSEIVAAGIPSGIVIVNSDQVMQRLMEVTDVVNEQPQCIWFGFFVIWVVLFESLVGLEVFIAIIFPEPRYDLGYWLWKRHWLSSNLILRYGIALVQVWRLLKVPESLELSVFVLHLVRKYGAFHEWVIKFLTCQIFLVSFLQHLKHGIGLL